MNDSKRSAILDEIEAELAAGRCDVFARDAELAPLQFHGGPTQTRVYEVRARLVEAKRQHPRTRQLADEQRKREQDDEARYMARLRSRTRIQP